MDSAASEKTLTVSQLSWADLSDHYREGFTGKLAGMWGIPATKALSTRSRCLHSERCC